MMDLRLRNQIRIRENVPKNLESLKNSQRKALWQGIRSLAYTSVFQIEKALSWSLPVQTREGLTRIGVFLRKGVAALVKVVLPRRLIDVLAVFDLDRVMRSTKDVRERIVDDKTSGLGGYQVRVSAVDSMSLVWYVESRWITNGRCAYFMTVAGYAPSNSSRRPHPA